MSRSHLQVPFTLRSGPSLNFLWIIKTPRPRGMISTNLWNYWWQQKGPVSPDDLAGADTQGPRWNPSAPPDYKTFIIDKINSLIDKNQVTSLGGAAKRPARKTYRGKTSRRKTSRGKTSRRKTYRRKTNRKKTSRRKTNRKKTSRRKSNIKQTS